MFRLNLPQILGLVCVFVVVGCGESGDGDRADRVAVTGTVTYNGTPVEGATVAFVPQGADTAGATGRTDASGRYELTTFEPGDGAVPGSYKVKIAKTVVAGVPQGDVEVDLDASGAEDEAPEAAEVEQSLPDKYQNEETSGLTAEVTADGDNEFSFELTD